MSNKTTEEAAGEKYPPIRRDTQSGGIYSPQVVRDYNRLQISKQEAFVAGYDSLSTTIAQLREENERLKGAMLVWIDIQDRLPEYDTTVVLYCPKRDFITDPLIIQGWFQKFGGSGFFTSIYLHEDEEIDVSHWQPLPSPPTQALTPKQPKTHA